MDMEVMVPPVVDFNLDSNSAYATPYISASSSPQSFGTFFLSAPTSPSQVPFNWEEKPGTPKSRDQINEDDGDFAFDFSGQLERNSFSSADELFHGGKIKALKPPPRLHYQPNIHSPRSPKQKFKEAFSFRNSKKKELDDPFVAAMEQSTKTENLRGRERLTQNHPPRHKKTRSLSPFRVSDLLFDQEKTNVSSSITSLWYRKWKLKDLFLFMRSASEGRASSRKDDDEFLKRSSTHEKEDVKNSSFRSTGGSSVSSSIRRGPVSAHELHYTLNRALSEEMKKKTLLPYKKGVLGCLGFIPSMHHTSSRPASVSSSVSTSMPRRQ